MEDQNNNGQGSYQGGGSEPPAGYGMYPYPTNTSIQPPMSGQYPSYTGAPIYQPHMIYPPTAPTNWSVPGGGLFRIDPAPPQASTSQAGGSATDETSTPEPSGPKKRGRKPLPGAAERRKEQNRQAQKTFREKRETYLRDLEATAASATENYRQIFGLITSLSDENNHLRTGLGRPAKDINETLKLSPLGKLYETFRNMGPPQASDSEQSSTKSLAKSSARPRSQTSGGSASGTQSSASDSQRAPALPAVLSPPASSIPQQHDYRPPIPPAPTADSSVTGSLPYDQQ